MTNKIDHAIVIGGSMAGLLAARVLVDHVDQVTILDRDRLPEGPQQRPGVPQSPHVHALLPGAAQSSNACCRASEPSSRRPVPP